ncbi:hypothetical protein [Gilliamella sp. B3367]|uniref:hypothetical protein n=1 Tax=Gilliamella sp. B3367 TaxID=2817989 RepID=UPI00226ACCF9|nr:hypothetical protein [Gilliamella sp. B3367]MCX8594399.1 hypothetical protein [Gilliamella sp. B3367]
MLPRAVEGFASKPVYAPVNTLTAEYLMSSVKVGSYSKKSTGLALASWYNFS